MLALSIKPTKTSDLRVYIILKSFIFSSILPILSAILRAIFFSKYPFPLFPESCPPCPASNTTTKGFSCDCILSNPPNKIKKEEKTHKTVF